MTATTIQRTSSQWAAPVRRWIPLLAMAIVITSFGHTRASPQNAEPESVVTRFISVLSKPANDGRRLSFENTMRMLEPVVQDTHNFTAFAGNIIGGRNWKRLNAAQRDTLVELSGKWFLHYYTGYYAYLRSKGLTLKLSNKGRKKNSRAWVFTATSTPSVKTRFKLFKSRTEGWRIYDFTEGENDLSYGQRYSSYLREEFRKNGFDGVLSRIETEIEKLRNVFFRLTNT